MTTMLHVQKCHSKRNADRGILSSLVLTVLTVLFGHRFLCKCCLLLSSRRVILSVNLSESFTVLNAINVQPTSRFLLTD